jgi:hypothetical protein
MCRSQPSTISKSIFSSRSRSGTVYRSFSTTPRRGVKTTEMSDEELAAVKIDRERLWKDLHSTCEWGKGEKWGE